jgi:hypothetical protein
MKKGSFYWQKKSDQRKLLFGLEKKFLNEDLKRKVRNLPACRQVAPS